MSGDGVIPKAFQSILRASKSIPRAAPEASPKVPQSFPRAAPVYTEFSRAPTYVPRASPEHMSKRLEPWCPLLPKPKGVPKSIRKSVQDLPQIGVRRHHFKHRRGPGELKTFENTTLRKKHVDFEGSFGTLRGLDSGSFFMPSEGPKL